MYMNSTKRYLIMAAAILNLISTIVNLVFSILYFFDPEVFAYYSQTFGMFGFSANIVLSVISFAAGFVGSVLLLYSIRSRGKYFRSSSTLYYTGVVITIICGGWLTWILLMISMFVPDVIIMNKPSDVKKEEILQTKEMEEKKQKIEHLKKLRDDGVITEEEYKEKLFELL